MSQQEHEATASGEAPSIAPELRRLPRDAARFWTDAAARREALEAIVSAWERGGPELSECVRRVDDAVVAGLRALALPRGPVLGVSVESIGQGWAGRKYPDCRLVLDADVMRDVIRARRRPDDFVRTWVHESLHARRPYARGAASEARLHQGYEEGLVESLARLIVRDRAGLRPLEVAYAYYVAAYRTLVTCAGVDAEALLRSLWAHATGEVRAGFLDALDGLRRPTGGPPLGAAQRGRIQAIADQLFATARINWRPDETEMERQWRMALA